MISKACFKCGKEKPLDDFYRHTQMADGHLNKCKPCTKEYERQRRQGPNRSRILEKDRARGFHGPSDLSQRYKLQHPERRAAQVALGNAVRDGHVTPWPACSYPGGCDSTNVEAHHADYSRPLDVVWVCPSHHRQAHALFTRLLSRDHH